MNLNMDNCWGIISALINLCMDLCEADGEHPTPLNCLRCVCNFFHSGRACFLPGPCGPHITPRVVASSSL